MPAARTRSAVASAMCSSGTSTAASICGATLCMVFVHSTMKSAPARRTARAAFARISPDSSHLPACCSFSISSNSTL